MNEVPFVVALTGGIASGKTAVSDRFAALGARIVDADQVSRELVAPGSPALAEIAEAFGNEILDKDGALNRRGLRERVFSDADARLRLQEILHPRVRAVLRERARTAEGAAYVMLVIPLLAEGEGYEWVDRVLVVDVPRDVQKSRLVSRDNITPALADAMLDAQASRAQRLAIADDVVINDGSLIDLDERVDELHRKYLALAGSRRH